MSDTNFNGGSSDGSSRRSFLKGAAALAGGYSVLQFDHVVSARGEPMGNLTLQDRGANALVFAWQFLPELPFELVTEIDNPEDILEELDEESGIQPVSNPDEFDAFVIAYDTPTRYFAIAFFEEDASVGEGDRFQFSRQSSITSKEFSIMDTDALVLQEVDDGDETTTAETETTTESATTTEAETTTQAVVVTDDSAEN